MIRCAIMPEMLQADIDLVEGEAAKLSVVNKLLATDYAAWCTKRRAAETATVDKLVGAGAIVRFKGGDTAFRFRGLLATSTCGLPGALANWARAARSGLAEPAENAA